MTEPVFKISSIAHSEGIITASLEVNINSDIFKGHFPDQPVVPGACTLQILKEILVDTLKAPLKMAKADNNIKFLSLILPQMENLTMVINYHAVDGQVNISAGLFSGELVCMRFKGIFIPG